MERVHSVKKFQAAILAILLVTLVVVQADTWAAEETKEKLDPTMNELKVSSTVKIGSKSKEFLHEVGMPLYRVKGKPGVLIPAYEVQALTRSRLAP